MKSGSILLADDEPSIREGLASNLRREGHDVTAVSDGNQALAAIEEQNFEVVITDLRMEGSDGMEVLRRTREISPQSAVLIITAFASIESAVEALRHGAHDYMLKPLVLEDVLSKVQRALEFRQLVWESQTLRRALDARFDVEDLTIGKGKPMRQVMELVAKVAATDRTVLITGESGVGKEVLARAIHRASPRRDKLFLPVNCGAIPEHLLETQLFGHQKGAFTGAVTSEEGLFRSARGGTILLDEIGDLPPSLQGKLLRAIEQKEILRVGASAPAKVDVRILAATNRDLAQAVEEGTFRQDLYYRLSVVEIRVPPLRERRPDVPRIVEALVRRHNGELKRKFKGADNEAMRLLLHHPWKGNIRELENVIQHAMIVGNGEWITVDDLPRSFARPESESTAADENLRAAVRSYEKTHIQHVLRRSAGDLQGAAEVLGLSRASLYRRLKSLGIDVDRSR